MSLQKDQRSLKLNTGAEIPALGLGTWQSRGDAGYISTKAALEAGYMHVDTAAIYKNEDQVGRAIRESNVPREKLFVTTKLWCTQQREPAKALDESLQKLGLDYVDLYLMHWPVPMDPKACKDGDVLQIPELPSGERAIDKDWDFVRTWEGMEKLLDTGKVRAIGVSNFSISNLETLFAKCKVVPACNQVEVHPLLPQHELLEFCQKKGIVLEAYSPLGSTNAPILQDELIKELAEKHNVQPAQLVISWHLQRGYVVLPKSSNPDRVASNLQTLRVPDEDMEALNTLSKKRGEMRVVNPKFGDFPLFK